MCDPTINKIILSRIYGFSTVSTSNAACIIGGRYTSKIIAEFKNDVWSRFGTLAKGRFDHGSISLGHEFMVIGGLMYDDRLVYFKNILGDKRFRSDKETEIWQFTNGNNKIINPTLPNMDYIHGIGLYLVPFDFCTT